MFEVGCREDQVGAEGSALPCDGDVAGTGDPGTGGEPALLIIFAVVGQEGFRHDSEDAAARDDHAAIVDAAVAGQRGTDEKDGLHLRAGCNDCADRRFGGAMLRGLQVQIVDRVGR